MVATGEGGSQEKGQLMVATAVYGLASIRIGPSI